MKHLDQDRISQFRIHLVISYKTHKNVVLGAIAGGIRLSLPLHSCI